MMTFGEIVAECFDEIYIQFGIDFALDYSEWI